MLTFSSSTDKKMEKYIRWFWKNYDKYIDEKFSKITILSFCHKNNFNEKEKKQNKFY